MFIAKRYGSQEIMDMWPRCYEDVSSGGWEHRMANSRLAKTVKHSKSTEEPKEEVEGISKWTGCMPTVGEEEIPF